MIATNSSPLPPGSFGLPLVGETLSFLLDRNFADKRRARYGDIFKTRLLGRPTVVLMGTEANQFVLSTHMDSFSWRDGWPGTFKELLGESLFLQEGDEHRRNRKLLMPLPVVHGTDDGPPAAPLHLEPAAGAKPRYEPDSDPETAIGPQGDLQTRLLKCDLE